MMNDYCGSKLRFFGCSVLLVLAQTISGIATAAGIAIEVSECLALEDNFARLACYDSRARAAAKLNLAPPAVSAVAPVAAPVAAPAAAPAAAAPVAPAAVNVDPVLGVPVRQGPEPTIARKGAQPVAAANASATDYGKTQPQVLEGKKGKRELHDRITELESNGEGGWLVTLASGQVWRQNGSRRYNLRVGQEVRIYPSGWGDSFRLAVEELGSFIPVDRSQ